MLIINEKKQPKKVNIEIDEYIPFSISFMDDILSELYWRYGNGKTSLIEIGLLETGEICNITLTCLDQRYISKTDHPFTNMYSEEEGLPVFDTSSWKKDVENFSTIFKDEFNNEMSSIIGANFLELSFLSEEKTKFYLKNDRLRFGINSRNELSSIQILDISNQDIELLKINF
jgi:hypothetical protein